MGRLVANAGKRDRDKLAAEYGARLMKGLPFLHNWSYSATEQGQSSSVKMIPLRVVGACHVSHRWTGRVA
jgi:hypothetical protein